MFSRGASALTVYHWQFWTPITLEQSYHMSVARKVCRATYSRPRLPGRSTLLVGQVHTNYNRPERSYAHEFRRRELPDPQPASVLSRCVSQFRPFSTSPHQLHGHLDPPTPGEESVLLASPLVQRMLISLLGEE